MSDENKFILQSLTKVEDKQDKLLEVIADQNTILSEMQIIQRQHHESLEEHHRRTTLNEERLILLEKINHQFQAFIKGASWVLGGLITAATLALHFFK
jgi:hypothetical protein